MSKERKVWRRTIPAAYEPLDDESSEHPDAYLIIKPPVTMPRDDLPYFPLTDEDFDSEIHVYKYKKVEDKIRPVPAVIPEDFKVRRTFPHDPLSNLPVLPTHPPEFVPTKKISQERMDKLDIDGNPDMTEEEKKLLKHVLVLNERSIAFTEDERGTFRRDYFSDYRIPVTPHVPWEDKNLSLPPGRREEIIQMLKEKIKAGVYEETQSSYRSRWFCVKKKNGELRMVHDLQKLNGVTIRDTGVPPIMEDFVEAYAGRSVYSVLDMYWGFYARILDPESRDLTAFQTPLGPLRITSLPMGFTNSPAEFQASMLFILKEEIPNVADVFVDDIPIKGPASRYLDSEGKEETIKENPGIRRYMWEHLNDLHRILHRIGESGGTVSGKKMQLCRNEVEIVGQKCSREGRNPTNTRHQRITDWPTPVNVSEVHGFLGLCGTVRIWIKDYSQIARPLVHLTRKDQEFHWGEAQEKAFQELKRLVTSAPALRPIDYSCNRPVILSVDTSIHGIGFVLSQLDENGRRVPARYGSLPLPETANRYGQSKLELYGLFRALDHFSIYLEGAPRLRVEVDSSSILGMLKNPEAKWESPLNRWIREIWAYRFKLIHVPGTQHRAPDALSRRRYTSADGVLEGEPEESSGDEVPQPLESESEEGVLRVGVLRKKKMEKKDKEEVIREIIHFLETSKAPAANSAKERQRFLSQAARYYQEGHRLYRRHASGNNQRVLVDRKEREKVLWQLHDGYGHRGEWAIWEAIRIRFYWPGMRKDITQYVKSCHTCQVRNVKKMHILPTVSQPVALFSKVYLDIMKMPEAQGKGWIVACKCDLSGTTEARALGSVTGRALASFFIEQIIFRYGTVGELVTDNGSALEGEFMKRVSKYNIHRIKISPYNSQANGVVERGHFIIREALVKMCGKNISKWPSLLQAAVFADRITIRRATGYSPYYLLHGVHPVLPCDLAEATFMVPRFKERMTDEELLIAWTRQIAKMPEDLARAKEILSQSRFQSQKGYEERFANRIIRTAFKPGSLVLVRNKPLENTMSINRKILNRYMGPYRVVRETKGKAYILEELNGNLLRTTVAAFRLIPYVKREHLDGWARVFESWDQHRSGNTGSTDGSGTEGK